MGEAHLKEGAEVEVGVEAPSRDSLQVKTNLTKAIFYVITVRNMAILKQIVGLKTKMQM